MFTSNPLIDAKTRHRSIRPMRRRPAYLGATASVGPSTPGTTFVRLSATLPAADARSSGATAIFGLFRTISGPQGTWAKLRWQFYRSWDAGKRHAHSLTGPGSSDVFQEKPHLRLQDGTSGLPLKRYAGHGVDDGSPAKPPHVTRCPASEVASATGNASSCLRFRKRPWRPASDIERACHRHNIFAVDK